MAEVWYQGKAINELEVVPTGFLKKTLGVKQRTKKPGTLEWCDNKKHNAYIMFYKRNSFVPNRHSYKERVLDGFFVFAKENICKI